VLHLLTKSPLQSQGSTITLGMGERSVFQGSFRTAFLLSEQFGFKLSSQYMRGDEWQYVDPTEQEARDSVAANPTPCVTDRSARGLSSAEAQIACQRLGVRDFDIERWGLEARADYRFAADGTIVGTYGRNSSSGIEMTGLGAGQTNDWVYQYMQARLSKGRFFAQAYYNTSDAGDSFLLRDGVALIDQSTLFVTQAQHGFSLADERQEFTYGIDYFATRPDSRGSIYGSYENEDDINEWGVYVQSKTALSAKFDFIAAGRLDSHSILPDNVWSPRAALVFKPTEGQNIRFSYNRAFSTPTALNLFLDISGGLAPSPIGPLGYTVRAYGTGPNGWALQGSNGELLGMRSPFYPGGSSQLLPADIPTMWALAVGVLQAQGAIDGPTAAALLSFNPANTDIGRLLRDTNTGAVTPLASAVLPDVPPMVESNTETYELGWTGLIQNRLSITADVFYMKKNAFGSPLIVQTPLLFMNGSDIAAFLTPRVGAATAAQLAAGMAMLPIGVVSSDQVGAQGADLIATYRNVGDVDLWGADMGFQAYLNDQWTLSGSYSHMSEDYFEIASGAPIALNAPKDKGSLGLAFRDVVRGVNASARMRVSSGFPAESAGFVGTACITGGTGGIFEEDCVDDFAIIDLSAGYTIRNTGATVQLAINNVLGTPYRSFVGVPKIGRFALVRLRYDF
jgi:iron complex outermembrane receptor protein